jgi:transketolase
MLISDVAKLLRYYSLLATTASGSGHPTSCLSAADLMAVLFFKGYFRADLDNPNFVNNDRLIFSKGHAAPLFYSLYAVAGKIKPEELETLRQIDSRLEGHPTLLFPYTEAATGSLGQGLGIGAGMALNAKLDNLNYRTFVLLGDSEMAEGSVWEAMEMASFRKLDNLVAIVDVNRLGQRGETMHGHNVDNFKQKVEAFGWESYAIDGHNLNEIEDVFTKIVNSKTDKPKIIIAKTFKGAGISFLENQENWHGKALSPELFEKATEELQPLEVFQAEVRMPENLLAKKNIFEKQEKIEYLATEKYATRKVYGETLVQIAPEFENLVVLDGETSNSTFADLFKKSYPERFVEMYIAEQNMLSVALGLGRRGKIPFVSTFAAFLTRGFDQIRMSQYSDGNIKIAGSHCGVSIGEDGSSQMALEDLAMIRSVGNSTVLYPSDAIACQNLVRLSAEQKGLVYLRLTREPLPLIYSENEKFAIGGSKTLKYSSQDEITLVSAGITLYECLEVYNLLEKEGIKVRVIDLYSIKPLDLETLKLAMKETKAIITVEDHYREGGIYSAVCEALAPFGGVIHSLAVNKMPRSGKPYELLDYAGISQKHIINKVKEIIS